ncbi:alpha/beta hydrolase, partial [Acinetobacter ursingii]
MNSIIQMDADLHQAGSTFGFFDIYHKDIFKQSASETWIDGWKVEFMAMADVRTIH